MRIVRKKWWDLQRTWPDGLCPRCGMEIYPGDPVRIPGRRRLCAFCTAARKAAGGRGAAE